MRVLLSRHFKKIIAVREEWLPCNNPGIVGPLTRKVDVITLECNHEFWQEKESYSLEESICDACLTSWLLVELDKKWATRIMKWWSKPTVKRWVRR